MDNEEKPKRIKPAVARESSAKKKEEIEKMSARFLELRPKTKLDGEFSYLLKSWLLEKFEEKYGRKEKEKAEKKEIPAPEFSGESYSDLREISEKAANYIESEEVNLGGESGRAGEGIFWKIINTGRFQYALSGAIVAILFIAPLTYYFVRNFEAKNGDVQSGGVVASAPNSPTVPDKTKPVAAVPKSSPAKPVQPVAQTSPKTLSAPTATPPVSSSPSVMTFSAPAVPQIAATSSQSSSGNFSYTGGNFSLSGSGDSLSFDCSEQSLSQISISKKIPAGYSVKADSSKCSVSLVPANPAWSEMQAQKIAERGGKIMESDASVAAAQKFLNENGVVLSSYLPPFYAGDSGDQTGVIFQLSFGGSQVSDENGKAFGIEVFVDDASGLVSGVKNITPANYEKTTKALETDSSVAVSIALAKAESLKDSFGISGGELGLPRKILIKSTDSSGKMILDPGLLFQIIGTSKSVAIPLAK